MIPLDITTILSITALNLFAVSAALPTVMGKEISASARLVQGNLLAQAIGWACIVSAEYIWDMPLSVLAMAMGSAANYMLYLALQGWLGPRPWKQWLRVACVVMPVGYALTFSSYPIRVGWANAWLALQFLLVARAALGPVNHWGRRWRHLLAGCYCLVALLTLARGVLGAFFTELYPTFTTPHPVNLLAQLVVNISMPLTIVALLVAWRRESESRLRLLANTDGLTELTNRRGFMDKAQQMVAQARRQQWPLGVMMLDLDHFKRVNDEHGHEMGDAALKLFASAVRDCLRQNDLAGRLGGEEFALLLPHTDAEGARQLDARLRELLRLRAQATLGWPLNHSAGFALCPLDRGDPLRVAMQSADRALYQAKGNGRGQLVLDSSVEMPGHDI